MCVGAGGGEEPLLLDHIQAISAKIRHSAQVFLQLVVVR